MKCIKCECEKESDEFHWKSKSDGTRISTCKSCRKIQAAARWASGSEKEKNYESKARRVARAQDYLWSVLIDASCADCGETNPLVFEFDHVRGETFLDVARMVVSNYGVEAIRLEVEKCDVVCANCHKIRTSTRANHWRVKRLAL